MGEKMETKVPRRFHSHAHTHTHTHTFTYPSPTPNTHSPREAYQGLYD